MSDVLKTARLPYEATGNPVIILLKTRLDQSAPRVHQEGPWYQFATTPAEIQVFQAATTMLRRFGEATTDESYDAYILK